MTTDICIICGAPIPEGRQVCPECLDRTSKKKQTPTEPPKKPGFCKKKRRP